MIRSRGLAVAAMLGVGAASADAQSILDGGVRAGPQFVQYRIDAPVSQTISEFALPIFAFVPITPRFAVDVGTAWAWSRVESPGTAVAPSTISGLTDTQLRASYVIGADAVVLTLGVNIPTGASTATGEQLVAATLIGNDFLAFPVTSFGTGFGATGGIAVARHVGAWNLGVGASLRRSAAYDPFEDAATGARFRYQPGNEFRGRVGVDRLVGSGRLALGLTYSTFGKDVADGSVYNTGDRFVTQASYGGRVGPGDLTVAVWDLFRGRGRLADGTRTEYDQIANVFLAYGFRRGRVLLEPSAEVRNWQSQGSLPSTIANLGFRTSITAGALSITPAVRYGMGVLGTPAGSADLSGWQALLTFGLQRQE